MTHVSSHLENIIEQMRWVVGGQNYDEDFHFSSFYIRLSSKKYRRNNSAMGYNTIISVYQNFNETYYIPHRECERVATYLLEKVKSNPEWMNRIVEEIYRRSIQLKDVFGSFSVWDNFSNLSREQIKHIYKKHFSKHWK